MTLTETLLASLPSYGLSLLGLVVFASCLGAPLPASIVMMLMGALAAAGDFTLWIVIAVALGAALWIFRDIPADIIEAKYVAPNSQFIDIDGVRFHYRDEGEGPAVLLLHAQWSSLIMWDKWAEVLKDSYRVVRLDLPGQGLTGPDPTGEYSMPRYVSLLKKFADTLGIDHSGRPVIIEYKRRKDGNVIDKGLHYLDFVHW